MQQQSTSHQAVVNSDEETQSKWIYFVYAMVVLAMAFWLQTTLPSITAGY